MLIDRSSILCFALMQVHCGIDQCNDKTCQDPGRKGHRHAFLTFLHGPGHITDTILIRFVGAFVYVIIHCVQGLVDLVIAKIIIDISTGRQPASLLSFIGIVQQQNSVAVYLVITEIVVIIEVIRQISHGCTPVGTADFLRMKCLRKTRILQIILYGFGDRYDHDVRLDLFLTLCYIFPQALLLFVCQHIRIVKHTLCGILAVAPDSLRCKQMNDCHSYGDHRQYAGNNEPYLKIFEVPSQCLSLNIFFHCPVILPS